MGGAGGGARWDCGDELREPPVTCTDDAPTHGGIAERASQTRSPRRPDGDPVDGTAHTANLAPVQDADRDDRLERPARGAPRPLPRRSEEHTSELQSRFDLVCRLLLEKKKNESTYIIILLYYMTY